VQSSNRPLYAEERGAPVPGAVFIFLMPAENVPGHPHYSDVRDIVSQYPQIDESGQVIEPPLSAVAIEGDKDKKCLVSRSLVPGKVWSEVYGLRVEGRLFRCWAQYRDESDQIEEYRATIARILSAVSVRGAGHH